MMKTTLMVLGLAAGVAAATACSGLFAETSTKPSAQQSCDGLEGQAKLDCEKNRKP